MSDQSVRVGVLSFHDSKESKAILNAIDALGHEPVWLRAENTLIHCDCESFILEPDVDVIANRLLLSTSLQPSEEVGIANAIARHRPMLNPPDAAALATHKIATSAILVDAGIPVPETILALSVDTIDRVRSKFGPEFVYKTVIGTHGGGTWKIDKESTITGTVGSRRAFLQEYITTNRERPRDLRVYVVDDDVIGAMYRYAPKDDWRTNVALGGQVEGATDQISDEVRDLSLKATRSIGLDYAGVDLIESESGWLVLEVNPTAGFRGLFKATGVCPAPYIAKLAIDRAGGVVDEDRIVSLAATFDDSIPRGAPRGRTTGGEDAPVIGATERVVVSGAADTRTVIGLADTGTDRTTIDLQLADRIGAGPIHASNTLATGKTDNVRPVVDIVVGIAGLHRTVPAYVEDRRDEPYPLLLGHNVLRDFRIDVNRSVDAVDVRQYEE